MTTQPSTIPDSKSPNDMLRMTFLFAVLFFGMHFIYQACEGTIVETWVIDKATVAPSSVLINHIDSQAQVRPIEHRLVSDQARLNVLNGCEGTEMLFMVIAAVLAFRCNWRAKMIGLVGGVVLIYSLNQLRIVALFFSLLEDAALFAAIHGYIGPVIIVLITAYCYLVWIKWATQATS